MLNSEKLFSFTKAKLMALIQSFEKHTIETLPE